MNYLALQAELVSDPQAIGYTGSNLGDATLLNIVDRPRNRSSMSGKEVKDAMDTDDWDSRTDSQKQVILAMTGRDDLDPFGIDQHIFQEAMSGAAGNTMANLAAARVETVSRAVELNIGFVIVSEGMVAKARAT